MRKNTIIMTALILGLSMTAMTGCGSKKDTTSSTPAPTATATTAADEQSSTADPADIATLQDQLEKINKLANGYQQDVKDNGSEAQVSRFDEIVEDLQTMTDDASNNDSLTQVAVADSMTKLTDYETELTGIWNAAMGNTSEETANAPKATDATDVNTSEESVMNADDAITELNDRLETVTTVSDGYAQTIEEYASVGQKEEYTTANKKLQTITKKVNAGGLSNADVAKYLKQLKKLEKTFKQVGEAAIGDAE